jgi:arylsulfatase A
MNRREFISNLGLTSGAIALSGCATPWRTGTSGKTSLPNIVIVLADDLGYGDPGCYNDQSKIPTPYIDKLAKQGVRFTDAHTPASVCTPTRYALLTGRYCWRSELKKSVLWSWDPSLIEPDRLTMPEMLHQRGYGTACIGKWHLGWDWPTTDNSRISDQLHKGESNPKVRWEYGKKVDFTRSIGGGPTTRGFDYYFGDDVPNFPPYCFIENDHVLELPSVEKRKDMFGSRGPATPGWQLDEVMPTITKRAVQYIDDNARHKEKPFFLYFTLTAPHTPIAPDEPFIGKSGAGRYGDYVVQVDYSLGQIMQALKKNGIDDNTILIFTSDNGSPQRDGTNYAGKAGSVKRYGHDPSRPWRGMKADIWEAGHRVPFVVRWPGRTIAGTDSAETICLTDLMTTFAGIVNHSLPADSAEDSYDILPALLGKKMSRPIRPDIIHHSHKDIFAIRQGDWKLILGKGSGGFTRYKPPKDAPRGQLYNLTDDPSEQNNLYNSRPDKVKSLTALLNEYKSAGRSAPRP